MSGKCSHPTIVPDDGSARYFHCLTCHKTMRLIRILGPLGREDYKFIELGEREVS